MTNNVDPELVRAIVEEVLKAQPRRDVIRETVHETLTELGVDHSDPMEMQKDFQHLREWRITMDQARNKSILAIVGFLTVGIMTALWIGFKSYFQQ